uniref:Polyamine modulated factor 1 n=1 Tax=Rousettus aegyptiacus TaxID=9407 RepID=A0A7J8BH83_ROUAE|nr:polyamine modulated factor 1 [Rousettus aegyptiacus]
MAEASNAEAGGGCAERAPERPSAESAPPGPAISRMKLLDTTVDTFLEKLVAAGRFIAQLRTSVREEVAEIKAEGNLEAVLSTLDAIVEEGKAREEPAWRPSGVPEKDMRSALAPGLLQQRDTLRRRVQRQEAENRQLAVAVRAGRRQLEALRLQGQARWQAWQAVHRGQEELAAVLRGPE